MRRVRYDAEVSDALLKVLHKITCVRIIKPSGNRSWELRYGRLKTYSDGVIVNQIGGKNEQYY